MKSKELKFFLLVSLFFIFSDIILGAFGAHALKNMLDDKMLETFKTGVTYQMYAGLGMLGLIAISKLFQLDFNKEFWLLIVGVTFFSGNCYLYTLSGIKTFAMLVPIGGFCMILGFSKAFINIGKNLES